MHFLHYLYTFTRERAVLVKKKT